MTKLQLAKIELDVAEYAIVAGEGNEIDYKVFFKGKDITDTVTCIIIRRI